MRVTTTERYESDDDGKRFHVTFKSVSVEELDAQLEAEQAEKVKLTDGDFSATVYKPSAWETE